MFDEVKTLDGGFSMQMTEFVLLNIFRGWTLDH